jgi:hypothetical protein
MGSVRGYTFGAGATGLAFETGWNANTVKMVIDNTGNVGIGTVSPNKKLHVYSTSPNAEIDIQSVVGDGNHWGLYNDISNNSFKLWGGADHLTVLRDGRVGIGTTAPSNKLNVFGTNGDIIKFGDNTNFGYLGVNSTTGGPYLFTTGTQPIRFGTSNTERVRIDSAGNVGIGITNPGSYKLYVNGDTNINGTLTATSFVGPVTGTLNAANVSSGAFGGNTGGGNYSFPGSVGVGTASPSSNGGVNATILHINDADTGHWSGLHITNGNTGTLAADGTILGHIGDSNFQIFNYENSDIKFSTNAITRMTIKSDGNIGIGTTNPNEKLMLWGDSTDHVGINVYNNTFGTNQGNFYLHKTGSAYVVTDQRSAAVFESYGDMIFSAAKATGVTAPSIKFQTGRSGTIGNTRMIVDSTGNVGIGTTDPGVYRLKVAGDVAITGTLQTQTGSDFAEEFSVFSDLEPGTVVTMADDGYKSVKAANKAYDSKVVGIVSDNPSIIAGRVESEKKVVVAMMGVVSVKVSDVNGVVKKGDLLTSSAVSGYAMKAVDYKPGTIIGKALEDLAGKSGSIKVLVNLQ